MRHWQAGITGLCLVTGASGYIGGRLVPRAARHNYFLPLIMFSQNDLFPLTAGMGLGSRGLPNSR